MIHKGVVAAGHAQTAAAARIVLEAGGNAFDAVLAAQFAACVAEPVLASLGGGGFLLARTAAGDCRVYDFFAQTPRHRRRDCDFYPVVADFGATAQEFHIGMGSIATPGTVQGMFRIHRDLGNLPMARILEPAIRLARRGLAVNPTQADTFRIVAPILRAARATRLLGGADGTLPRAGDIVQMVDLAGVLEQLAREGPRWFYEGEPAARLVRDCRAGGGHLRMEDLKGYRVIRRAPLTCTYRGARILTNPPPSCGGALIAFGLRLLDSVDTRGLRPADPRWLRTLAHVLDLTQTARIDALLDHKPDRATVARLLGPALIRRYRGLLHRHPRSVRGTTHISVIDAAGNHASLSVSNGEGSGYVIPGCGIMANNMLGEEDLNAQGFHRWPRDRRLSSMMAPSLIFAPDGRAIALGSGGSNRIRSALLQVIVYLLDFGLTLSGAIRRPRLHWEGATLHVEGGLTGAGPAELAAQFPDCHAWPARSLYFGGVHGVMADTVCGTFTGAGDPRRGGAARLAKPRPTRPPA